MFVKCTFSQHCLWESMVAGCGHDEIKYIPGDLEQPEGNVTYL